MITRILLAIVALTVVASSASAMPRFAARTGADCRLCHVNPSGGGMRSRYGSSVFQRLALPLTIGDEAGDDELPSFSPQITEWLSLGADLRAAYLYSAPDVLDDPTSSFFLMQADLYTAAKLSSHVSVVLDIGVYSGFEAWVLVQAASKPSPYDLYLKVGRFMPTFGLRDPNHDLFTRQGIGLGSSDRDTGLELTFVAGPATLSVALVNGTFGDDALDGHGSDHRSFEKALVSRAAVGFGAGALHIQTGGSFYLSDNGTDANPLFRPALDAAIDVAEGVDELRAGAFLLAGLGPISYVGEAVYVRNRFTSGGDAVGGYASAQELAVQVIQGVEVMATFELSDPDLTLAGDATTRAGLAAEVFLGPFFEVRVMGRRAFGPAAATDFLLFAHAAF